MNIFVNVLGLLITTNGVLSGKLNIILLYESLCPDSLKFFNEQFNPNWPAIQQHVDVHFVPFGKSRNIRGTDAFKCQHGPTECTGNKIQSCALYKLHDQNAQSDFVQCFMNVFGKQNIGQMCAEQVGLNWGLIEQCYNSHEGLLLQLQAERITRTPKFVPTIIYNGVFNQKDQDESLENFKDVVCRHLNKVYSNICK